MLKLTNKQNENFHVEILNDTSLFKDFELSFMQDVYDSAKKTMLIGGLKTYDKNDILELFAKINKILMSNKIKSASIDIRNFKNEDLLQIVTGLIISTYSLKKDKAFEVDFELLTNDISIDISEYICLANNMNLSKDLANTPANKLNPQDFVAIAQDLFKNHKEVEISIFSDTEVLNKGFMGLYTVGKGSSNRPTMLIMRYKPLADSNEILGLVGKGVTFDTGGYCLKPAVPMFAMKSDMSGAGDALAILKTIVEQKVQKNIVAVMPLCENRISESSALPGDIITMYDGTTVEILNTDAEGRLILADAISYVIKDEKATEVIDMATLTGSAVTAFGFTITPTLSNNDDMFNKLAKASEKTGEKFHKLPYYKEHQKMIESSMADLRNIGGPQCGCITSGLFLKHFAKNTPWIHLDIAGPNFIENPMYEYQQKGATGAVMSTVYYMIKEN